MTEPPPWVSALFTEDDLTAITQAVAAAERGTAAEIRVHLEPRVPRRPLRRTEPALERARSVMVALGMQETRERTGVLIYLAVQDRQLAIVGDEAVHARVGDQYWARVRDLMVDRLRGGTLRDAILAAIADVGAVLATYFPRRPDDTNELPDQVSLGP